MLLIGVLGVLGALLAGMIINWDPSYIVGNFVTIFYMSMGIILIVIGVILAIVLPATIKKKKN